ALRHRPSVIRLENRTKDWREDFEQRLLRQDVPVVDDPDDGTFLHECPFAPADEIASRLDREPQWIARLGDDELPAKWVGEPAFRPPPHAPARSRRLRWFELLRMEIHRRPPANERGGITDDVGNFSARRFDLPLRDEVIAVHRVFRDSPKGVPYE